MRIYFDNAATTILSREVFQAMEPYLFENFGNPSSSHSYGKQARAAIEISRATIAQILNTDPGHIIFTAGGTEADNTAILSAIRSNNIKLVITTKFEHHAVLNTLNTLQRRGEIQLIYLKHDAKGNISLSHLDQLLAANQRALVSVIHGNNEIGNLNDIHQIAACCNNYDAVFHSDTVQTMGHLSFDTSTLKADFLVASAHKFHGPKGVGFLYKRSDAPIIPFVNGGSQESGQRSGTENVAGIVGLAKALELAHSNHEHHSKHLRKLKYRMIGKLQEVIPDIAFNGNTLDPDLSLNSILSISLPNPASGMPILNYLDQHYIYASGGSACTSHLTSGSHVLRALGTDSRKSTIRFSFSRYNTFEEVDHTVNKLAACFKITADDFYVPS